MIEVQFTPWFYGELALLGIAALIGLNSRPR